MQITTLVNGQPIIGNAGSYKYPFTASFTSTTTAYAIEVEANYGNARANAQKRVKVWFTHSGNAAVPTPYNLQPGPSFAAPSNRPSQRPER